MEAAAKRQRRSGPVRARRPRLTPEQRSIRLLRALLEAQSISLQDVAERVGCSRHLVSKVALRQRSNQAVREAVAKSLGLTYEHVWGSMADTHLYEALRRTLVEQHLVEVEADLRRAAGE